MTIASVMVCVDFDDATEPASASPQKLRLNSTRR